MLTRYIAGTSFYRQEWDQSCWYRLCRIKRLLQGHKSRRRRTRIWAQAVWLQTERFQPLDYTSHCLHTNERIWHITVPNYHKPSRTHQLATRSRKLPISILETRSGPLLKHMSPWATSPPTASVILNFGLLILLFLLVLISVRLNDVVTFLLHVNRIIICVFSYDLLI